MKNLAGDYRIEAYNSYTERAFIGELKLAQAGVMLAGSYRFSVNWEDNSPVPWSLPVENCDVRGEALEPGCQLKLASQSGLYGLPPEELAKVTADALLTFGDVKMHVLQLSGGSLLCFCSAQFLGISAEFVPLVPPTA